MDKRIGKDYELEYPRAFVPEDLSFSDPEGVRALYEQLAAREASSAEDLESWLRDWSELRSVIEEEGAVRYILMTRQTDDGEREKAYLHFVTEIEPMIKPLEHKLSEKMMSSPALKDLDHDRYQVIIREIKRDIDLFRDENVPLQTEDSKLRQRYQKITGAMTVDFGGKERTLQQMAVYLEKQDRELRRSAWEKVAARRLEDKDKLDDLFDEMLEVRGRIAANAGFDNYRDYAMLARGRFDYGVPECEAFHRAVEETAAPLYREFQKKRAGRMGLGKLRPWDLAPDPLGREPLEPFKEISELVEGCEKIYNRLDPELGRRFRFMMDHGLLDLDSRKGKAPGAYSHSLEEHRLPFIFGNFVGVDGDVYTLLHECGHSFHTFEARGRDLVFHRRYPMEFAEVASMSMEFLGGDHLDAFYDADQKARSRERHLESVVWVFCWVATIDAFQHWLYTHPGHGRDERARAWLDILGRFGGIEDWSGYEDARAHIWHRQLHIFEVPFYYIDYGVAELGALQVWARAAEDPAGALADYRKALALGGSRPLPELFEAAGARFDLSSDTLAPLIEKVRSAIESG